LIRQLWRLTPTHDSRACRAGTRCRQRPQTGHQGKSQEIARRGTRCFISGREYGGPQDREPNPSAPSQGADSAARRRTEQIRDGALLLERQGQLDRALADLQVVLAVEPDNDRALALQRRLLSARSATETTRRDRETITALVAEVQRGLDQGRIEDALRSAHRILAIDPRHDGALRAITQSYARLSATYSMATAPRRRSSSINPKRAATPLRAHRQSRHGRS
jgi:tetratricopeptide (TPR) repeat protein